MRLQVSDKERQAQQDNLFKDVAGVLVEKTVSQQHGASKSPIWLHAPHYVNICGTPLGVSCAGLMPRCTAWANKLADKGSALRMPHDAV